MSCSVGIDGKYGHLVGNNRLLPNDIVQPDILIDGLHSLSYLRVVPILVLHHFDGGGAAPMFLMQ